MALCLSVNIYIRVLYPSLRLKERKGGREKRKVEIGREKMERTEEKFAD
jgi:hypothetical protein